MIGQCGLTWQEIPGQTVPEVGYLFNRAHWHRGYAIEAARACRDHGFKALGFEAVYSIIRQTNRASQRVALKNGMRVQGCFVKHYHGIDMPHDIWCVRRGRR